MTKQSSQPSQTPPQPEHETAEVYSVSQDGDGSLHFSRKDFLTFSLAVGGSLLVKGLLCPRFGTDSNSAGNQPAQAGMVPATRVYVHAKPRIDSNILDTLKQNDIVRLIDDHLDLDWVEVATQAGRQGWLKRGFIDFSRALSGPPQGFFANSAEATGENSVYLPIIINNAPAQAPTVTPTDGPTATPSATPCSSDSGCPLYSPCTCDAFPCSCVADYCTCDAFPCSCVTFYCSCDAFPCSCNNFPCSCVTFYCSCDAFPCNCVADFCTIT